MTAIPLQRTPDPDDPETFVWEIDAEIDGATVRLVLDTGALQTELVGEVVTDTVTRGVFGSGRRGRRRVGSIRLGGHVLTDRTIGVVPLGSTAGRPLLGLDVLATVPFLLRSSTDELLIDRPAPDTTMPLRRDPQGHRRLRLTVPGTDLAIWAVLDTGAGITVLDSTLLQRFPALFSNVGASVGIDATGTAVRTPTSTIAAARLDAGGANGVDIAAHRVAFTDLHAATGHLAEPVEVILGTPALVQHDWWFDLARNRWAVLMATTREIA